MKTQIIDDHFNPLDLIFLRNHAIRARAWAKYDGYSMVSLARLRYSNVFTRVKEQALQMLPSNVVFCNGWFMVYDSECDGVPIHADDAHISVNIWITPNEYILRANERNGLIVYDASPPVDWEFDQYNGSPDDDAIQGIVKNAEYQHVKHRFNRAVVFDSKRFHMTNGVSTCLGEPRVNLTLMFDTVPI